MTKKKKIYGTAEFEKDFGRLSFGQMLEAHRLSEERSQKDFAKILGISASSLCDLEKGRKIPSAGRAARIAKRLRLSERLFLEIALQDQLLQEGLNGYRVSVA